MGKKLHKILGIGIIAAGLLLFLYPDIRTFLFNREMQHTVEEFEESFVIDAAGSREDSTKESLLSEVRSYNAEIYENGQENFRDAWSVTQTPLVLDGLNDGLFGYLEIPAMEIKLPLYAGATVSHMAEGAAILGETSLPVGGENTNSVIAGHRGYRGAPYFRDIEKLQPGDLVILTNPWGTLYYQMESAEVIAPDDSDAVKIQEGRDMITLLTCHPYRSHGKYRYVVYCTRTDGPQQAEEGQNGELQDGGWLEPDDGILFESSQNDIRMEQLVRQCGAWMIGIMAVLTVVRKLIRKKNHDGF